MKKINLFLKNNSSTILSIAASLGVIGTTVLAVKATPKALKLIELNKKYPSTDEESLLDSIKYGSITPIEIIKVAWKPYVPSILCGISTIICIFGSNYINKKNQKALVSAYGVLNNAYLNYKKNAIKLYGDEGHKNIQKEILKSKKINIDNNDDNDDELYFDMQSMRYFYSNFEKIKDAEFNFNQYLNSNGFAYLNDLYDLLGLDRVDYGYDLGWSSRLNDKIYSKDGVIFNVEFIDINDEIDCNILSLSIEPSIDFICY